MCTYVPLASPPRCARTVCESGIRQLRHRNRSKRWLVWIWIYFRTNTRITWTTDNPMGWAFGAGFFSDANFSHRHINLTLSTRAQKKVCINLQFTNCLVAHHNSCQPILDSLAIFSRHSKIYCMKRDDTYNFHCNDNVVIGKRAMIYCTLIYSPLENVFEAD